MGHPAIHNRTPFVLEPLFLADEEGRPLLVPVVKATYQIRGTDALELAEEQVALCPEGEYWGDPETSSYKYEPECAFVKPATDVVLIGHARPEKRGATEVNVGLRVGNLQKVATIFGDRLWFRSVGRVSMTRPQPFEAIPLIWDRSFGGWDRSNPEPDKHTFEPRNPVGTGFHGKGGKFEEGIRLPNIEDPNHLVKGNGDHPVPHGFGFVSPNWQPRAALAGTYDAAWMKTRMPLLPKDFDRRFLNAAPAGQVAPGYLRGDEPVIIANVGAPRTTFKLPGVPPPQIAVGLRGGKRESLQTQLDTVILNLDEKIVLLLWRAHLVVRTGPPDVLSIEARTDGATQPAAKGR